MKALVIDDEVSARDGLRWLLVKLRIADGGLRIESADKPQTTDRFPAQPKIRNPKSAIRNS